MSDITPLEAALIRCRPRLVQLAYRMMGTLHDAEDVVQDTWLRIRASESTEVARPEGYLMQAVVRQCLDRWKSARAQRESYIGPWLPEPVAADVESDAAQHAELAESLSFALLLMLESLNPVERAVYLLHDVFGYDFAEVSAVVDRSSENCRQIARRARTQLTAGRARFEPSPAQREKLVGEFIDVCHSGDVARLAALLADDVRLHSDGGGRVTAARIPLVGHDRVLRFLVGLRSKTARQGLAFEFRPSVVNGEPGARLLANGQLHAVIAFDVDGNQVRGLYFVLNPDKLRGWQARGSDVEELSP